MGAAASFVVAVLAVVWVEKRDAGVRRWYKRKVQPLLSSKKHA